MRIADDLTRTALKEMKVLERARARLFWRKKTENGGVYIHALLPPPDVKQIEAFTNVLQKTLVHGEPAVTGKLEERKRKLFEAFTRFPRKFQFLTAAKLPTGEGRIIEDSIDDPRNLEKHPDGTVAIHEMTGMLPHVGPGLLRARERYDFLLEYADVDDDPTKVDLPAFAEESDQGEKR